MLKEKLFEQRVAAPQGRLVTQPIIRSLCWENETSAGFKFYVTRLPLPLPSLGSSSCSNPTQMYPVRHFHTLRH